MSKEKQERLLKQISLTLYYREDALKDSKQMKAGALSDSLLQDDIEECKSDWQKAHKGVDLEALFEKYNIQD